MKKLSLLLCSFALLMPASAQAQRIGQQPHSFASVAPVMSGNAQPHLVLRDGIAAVVNDNIISMSDLKGRVELAAFSSGLPRTAETMQKLLPRVLRTLINEQLQLEEGQSKGFKVSDEEIDNAINALAKSNKVPNGDMESLLRNNGISFAALRSQIKASLIWKKVVMRTIRPRVEIGADEIESVVELLRANQGQEEYLVSEIFLAVEKPQDEAEIKELADRLAQQIKGGTPFGAVARQFSQGLGASTGGDLGWIQVGQLARELNEVLPTLGVNDVTQPVRGPSGYHILGVRDKRVINISDQEEASVKMKQAFRPFTPSTDKESLLQEAAALKEAVQGCSGLGKKVETSFPEWRLQDLGNVKMAEAPEWLVQQIKNIPTGKASSPMATGKGALILFVCERDAVESVDRDAIRRQLGTEKMSLMARRLQRDLRRDAYIDVRLK